MIAHVLQGNIPVYLRWLTPLEKGCYRISGHNPSVEQKAKNYLKDLLVFNSLGFIFLFILLLAQGVLPFNPENYSGLMSVIR
jgi:K+-transporting ATPase ATPase A chain